MHMLQTSDHFTDLHRNRKRKQKLANRFLFTIKSYTKIYRKNSKNIMFVIFNSGKNMNASGGIKSCRLFFFVVYRNVL